MSLFAHLSVCPFSGRETVAEACALVQDQETPEDVCELH